MEQLDSNSGDGTSRLPGSIHAAIRDLGETERYRVLSALFSELAVGQADADARAGVTPEQVQALKERVKTLDHERANAIDDLKTTQADLERIKRQLEEEERHGSQLKQTLDEQRKRIDATHSELEEVKAELVAKNNAVHRAENQIEELTLKFQRAEQAGSDRSGVEKLEHEKTDLIKRLEAAREEFEQLRVDKDAEIAKLEEQVRNASGGASADALLAELSEPLKSCSPPLLEGDDVPTAKSAERLVAALIELAQFVNKYDQGIRPFLTRYTKHHPSVKVPWDAYAKGDDLLKVVQRTIAPVGGRPVGVLKMRLRLLYQWTEAAMIGCDSALESIASELDTFVRGEYGMADNPNKTLKEFLRQDGHELFMQHIRELRSGKLGDAFGRGG